MSIWKSIRRWWARTFGDTYTGGLIQPGQWRCVYPDGQKTRLLSYGDAANLASIFGGTVVWAEDEPRSTT